MRITKNILSIFLTLTLLLTSFSVIATNEDVSNEDDSLNLLTMVEAEALYAMGMLGEDVAAMAMNSHMSRAQFVGSLSKIAGYDVAEYDVSDFPFVDLTNSTPYKNEIIFFYKAGIINGTSPTTFSPDEGITYQQAMKVIVCVLGYEKISIMKFGTELKDYMNMGVLLKLGTDVKITSQTEPIKAEQGIMLLYNASRTRIMEPSVYTTGGDITYENIKGDELISSKNKIYYGEGILQSNGLVSILTDKADENIGIISGREYLLTGQDLTNLIGCKVKFFYQDKDSTQTLLWVGYDSRTNMIEINAQDLRRDDTSYTMQQIVYGENGKKKTVKVAPLADVIYNNGIYNNATLETFKPQMGRIRLIDNNNDKIYDIVIVEEYINVFAVAVIDSLNTINDKYGKPICLDEYDTIKVYENGVEIEADKLEKGRVFSVFASKNKEFIAIHQNGVGLQDKLISYQLDSDSVNYEFEKASFNAAESYRNRSTDLYYKVEPRIGGTYKYYLDIEGNIAELEEIDSGAIDYAYLIDAGKGDSFSTRDSAIVKLLLRNGSITYAATSKKIKLNGEKGKDGLELLDDPRLIDEKGNIIEQVVRVGFDSKGDIKEFEFASDNTANEYGFDQENFSLDYHSTDSSYSGGGIYRWGKYVLDGTSTFFVKYTGIDVEEPYAVIKGSTIGARSNLELKLYDCLPDQSITVGCAELSGAVATSTPMLVADVFYKVIDDEAFRCIGAYYGTEYKEYAELTEGYIPNDIKRGDVVTLNLYDNRVVGLSKFVSLADRPQRVGTGSYPYTYRIFTEIYNVSNTMISLIRPDGFASDKYKKIISVPLSLYNSTPVTIYDVVEDEIYKGTITDVFSSASPYKNGVLSTMNGSVTDYDEYSDTLMIVADVNNYKVMDIIIVKY